MRFSAMRQNVTSACRKMGLCAQRFRITSELRSSAGMPEVSPAGASCLGEIDHQGDFLFVENAQAQIIVQNVQYAIGIARQTIQKFVP